MLEYKKKHKNISVYENKNHGVSYSRNFAIKKATGKYISFVDADDTLDKDFYENLVKCKKENTLIGSKIRKKYIDNKEEIIENKCYGDKIEFIKDLLLGNIDGYCWRFIYNKEDLIKVNFDESLSYMEDTYFLINYLLNCNIKEINFINTFYNYCQYSNSVTNKKNKVACTIKSIKKSIDKIFSLPCIKDDLEIQKYKSNRKLKLYESQIYKISDKTEFNEVKSDKNIIDDINTEISSKNTKTIYKLFYKCIINLPYSFFLLYKFLRTNFKKVMK